MDQSSAQPSEVQPPFSSPFKKFLPLIIIFVFILVIFSGLLALSATKSSQKNITPTPTPRPTATPFPAPTIPLVTPVPTTSSPSATISPVKIGRLAFIKDGDIYHSDLASYSLLVKNATGAGDRLSWSPEGNFLAWRQKTTTATPSALTVYSREKDSSFAIQPDKEAGELIDYAWSPDEKEIAVLFRNQSYNIGLYSIISPSSSPSASLVSRKSSISQLFWPKEKTIIFSTDAGIESIEEGSSSAKMLVAEKNVLNVRFSPDASRLLYAVGDNKKSDLYLINVDGSGKRMLPQIPAKVDMGTTGQSAKILDKGFIPYAVFFPKGDKLMVGYHFLTNLPLVGIYDIIQNSFTAIAPFILYSSDVMIDEYGLLGERINTTQDIPSWQISLFTLEDNANLATVRVIPGVSSPAFFSKDVSY